MPDVTQHGSLVKTEWRDESRISDHLVELSEVTRSQGYVHTARMIEEALSAYSFERRHLGIAKTYFSELQQLKDNEMTQLGTETNRNQNSVPNFRSARSEKTDGLPFGTAERSAGAAKKAGTRQGQAAFVLTARMRVDSRKSAALRNGHWKGKPMRFPAEPEFQFR